MGRKPKPIAIHVKQKNTGQQVIISSKRTCWPVGKLNFATVAKLVNAADLGSASG